MPTTISGSTGVTYPNGGVDNTTGAGVGTTDTQTLTNKTIQGGAITSGTAVATTSGTSIDFTSIPSWVKRITVMFSGVSTNGTSIVQVQLGYSGGIINSGYLGAVVRSGTGTGGSNFSSGFTLADSGSGGAAVHTRHGALVFSLLNAATYNWAVFGNIGHSDSANAWMLGGSILLTGTLTQIRITTVNGTDTFDAGSINILYE